MFSLVRYARNGTYEGYKKFASSRPTLTAKQKPKLLTTCMQITQIPCVIKKKRKGLKIVCVFVGLSGSKKHL